MVTGPVLQIPIPNNGTADLYLLRFDEDGGLLSPQTFDELKTLLPQATDVFCFSHGWNNDFGTALARYESFLRGYIEQRAELGLATPADYRPVLIGVIWPSTSFVMSWEEGPEIAGGPGPSTGSTDELLAYVIRSMPPDDGARLAEIVDGQTSVDEEEARRGAAIVLAALRQDADPEDGPAPDVGMLLDSWRQIDAPAAATAPVDGDFGTIGGPEAAGGGPAAAGLSFNPRNLLRAATVWKMKARAGVVGAHGVGPVVETVLKESEARLHLIGHSFGAKVVLSALLAAEPTRRARSMLLLEPAINRWCFAADVAGTGGSGGYRDVPDRLELPMLTTFSPYDAPLTRFFHLALRGGNLGEPQVAGFGDPDLYGALGGFGPSGISQILRTDPAHAPGDRYDLSGPTRIIAVDGGTVIGGRPAITGHGDVSNRATWWALHCLTEQT